MKKPELTAKSAAELARQADKLRAKLSTLKTDRYLKEVKNVRQIRATRRELARTLTLMTAAKGKE